MKTYTTEELKEVCRLNELYQWGKEGGVKAYLSGANLSGADLRGAYLRSAYLSGANLSGANLSGADLRGAYLRGADLNSADLNSANLNGATLNGANLNSADLRGADLNGADLSCVNLNGADLRGADLRGADLSCADLNGAIINWQSHTLISKLLTLWAGEDTNKLMIAGLVSVSTHLCWDGFLKIRNKHKREALEYLSTWVRAGDNAPSVLQKIKEKKVTIVQASS